MRSVIPTRIVASSSAQQDSSNGVPLAYTGCALVIPTDGLWQLFASATMSSTNVADAKRLALYSAATAQLLPDSWSPEGDPSTTGLFLPYFTEWSGPLRRGDVIQLYGQQNGSSIIRMGNSAVALALQRIKGVRYG